MTTSPKQISKVISLYFASRVSKQPIMCQLAKEFDLTFNIIKARITPKEEGKMVIELSGKEKDFKQGIAYLQAQGIAVQEVAQQITRDEDLCIHCGVCTGLCLSGALSIDPISRLVRFEPHKCTACSRCTKICPVKAMQVKLNFNSDYA